MQVPGAYVGKELVERYDHRHYGGRSGHFIFFKDCRALDSLLDGSQALVLDIPCGTGIYSQRFSEQGYRIISADASLPMLEIAGQRTINIPRLLCDANYLPFRENVFDAVMTIRLFQHCPKAGVIHILHELGRVIKPGGRVVFDTFRWTPRQLPLLRRFFRGDMYVYSQPEVEQMIQLAGLKRVRTVTLYLFSPIWQRKLPWWVLKGLDVLEQVFPERWLLRTFWSCTKV